LGRFVGSSPRQPAARHPPDLLCPLVGRFPRHPSALHLASIWRPPPPTSPRDSLVASSASICPTPGLHLPPHHHQRVLMTRWWLPRPPSALHHHQRVLATRWTVPPASFRLPTTTNESRRLVGRFPGLHLPFHHHQRCSLGFHQGYFIV
jgi:hypothetical protein